MAQWAPLIYGKQVDRAAAVSAIAQGLRDRGVRVAGFQQRKRREHGAEVVDLVRLATGQTLQLGVPRDQSPTPDGCSFRFEADAFATGRRWLEEDAPAARILVLDEIARLELVGQGHHAALAWALALPAPTLVLFSAREDRLSDIVTAFRPAGEPLAHLVHLAAGTDFAPFIDALARAAPPADDA